MMFISVDDKYIPTTSIVYIRVSSNCADFHLLNGEIIKTDEWYTIRDRLRKRKDVDDF